MKQPRLSHIIIAYGAMLWFGHYMWNHPVYSSFLFAVSAMIFGIVHDIINNFGVHTK